MPVRYNQRGNPIPTINFNHDDGTVSITSLEEDEDGKDVEVTRTYEQGTGDQVSADRDRGTGIGPRVDDAGVREVSKGAGGGRGDIPDRFQDDEGNYVTKKVVYSRKDDGSYLLEDDPENPGEKKVARVTTWTTKDGEEAVGEITPEFRGGTSNRRSKRKRKSTEAPAIDVERDPNVGPLGERIGLETPPGFGIGGFFPPEQFSELPELTEPQQWGESYRSADQVDSDQTDVLGLQPSDYQRFASHQPGYVEDAGERNLSGYSTPMYSGDPEGLLANTPWAKPNENPKGNTMTEVERLKALYIEAIQRGRGKGGVSSQDRVDILIQLQRNGMTFDNAVALLRDIDISYPAANDPMMDEADLAQQLERQRVEDERRLAEIREYQISDTPFQQFLRSKDIDPFGSIDDQTRASAQEGFSSQGIEGRSRLFGDFIDESTSIGGPEFLRTLLSKSLPKAQSAFQLTNALGGATPTSGLNDLNQRVGFGGSFSEFLNRPNPLATFGTNLSEFLNLAGGDLGVLKEDNIGVFNLRQKLIDNPSSAFNFIENQRNDPIFSEFGGPAAAARQRAFNQAIRNNPSASGIDLLNFSQQPGFASSGGFSRYGTGW
jgi:hypothetical protein